MVLKNMGMQNTREENNGVISVLTRDVKLTEYLINYIPEIIKVKTNENDVIEFCIIDIGDMDQICIITEIDMSTNTTRCREITFGELKILNNYVVTRREQICRPIKR